MDTTGFWVGEYSYDAVEALLVEFSFRMTRAVEQEPKAQIVTANDVENA